MLRNVIVLNPAQSVRGPKLATVEGRTPEIGPAQIRQLLGSIPSCDVVAVCDRALIATLVYTAARVGAVVRLRLRDLHREEATWSIRFHEKGGKQREIPVREDLRHLLSEYLARAGADTWPADAPIFRSAVGKTKTLSDRPLTPGDACRMLKRRLRRAELPMRLSPHSFRVAVVNDLLQHGASLEDLQNLAGHADPRTTRLYDRRQRHVNRNLVDRITI